MSERPLYVGWALCAPDLGPFSCFGETRAKAGALFAELAAAVGTTRRALRKKGCRLVKVAVIPLATPTSRGLSRG